MVRVLRPRLSVDYTSDELVHLVGSSHPSDDEANFETLKLIVESGEIRTRLMEAGSGRTGYLTKRSGSLVDESRLDPNVTCYADIPRRSLAIHVTKYGRFGLSFDRAWMAHQGARPVMYVPKRRDEFFSAIGGSQLLRDLDAIHEGLLQHCEKQLEGVNRASRRMRAMGTMPRGELSVLAATKTALELYLMAFIKPFDVQLARDDPKSFYMEREWRKFGNLQFEAKDVVAVYVAPGHLARAKLAFPSLRDKILRLA